MKPVKNQSRTSWSKCLLQTLVLGTIVLLAAAPARAVTFTWTTNAYLSGTSNFMTLAPGWAKLASFSIGGSQVTFGGETWSATERHLRATDAEAGELGPAGGKRHKIRGAAQIGICGPGERDRPGWCGGQQDNRAENQVWRRHLLQEVRD